ncbi:ABC transporter ATP-binding protein [Chelatococcus asaccharovorans]|uniref:ABC transporter ATP-binding protein n=1 Tax=Chelatococcus asaccharovorans TaxID=28210 RepID=UPI00224C7742|nr:oligopeptide/dipeptide ABC transporter ATP-binding protein [Chelatococcus asaccharovorans]CAH1672516.1 murein tripeptide ABC transporter/oligopeptide ABC transporter ATP binding subunit OppF [Chelatococcus asaccharovorans]CAH1676079.1 murein tripeptide ABC transporter/oligopeptide ABC transporter ATP binding subunit OppF [Chelatococcus asaccharovorans]
MTDAQRSQTQETDSPDTLLTVTHLRRHFGGRHALLRRERTIRAVEDVSLTLRVGETLGLVGESGCGKSTTGRMIVGLETPSSGTITFKGRDLTQLTPKDWQRQRRDVQMIFQNPQSALDPRLTIARQIREPLDLHDIGARAGRDDEVARLMQAVALPVELADRYPHQISGGQAQRVVIARALAMRPSLIVCDEPVSALDVSVQATVTDLLQDLQERLDIAYLFISHDLRVVKKLSHRVAVMYLGQIVEEGLTDPLYRQPLHPYTMALLAAIPDLSVAKGEPRARLVGDPPSPANPPSGCHFHTRCPYAQPRCSAEKPELRAVDDRRVRCHFAEDFRTAS